MTWEYWVFGADPSRRPILPLRAEWRPGASSTTEMMFYALFPVGSPMRHDVVAALAQQLVERGHRRLLFYNDADEGDSGFHVITSPDEFLRQKPHRLCDTVPRARRGGQFSLWRIFRRKKTFGVRSLVCIVGGKWGIVNTPLCRLRRGRVILRKICDECP